MIKFYYSFIEILVVRSNSSDCMENPVFLIIRNDSVIVKLRGKVYLNFMYLLEPEYVYGSDIDNTECLFPLKGSEEK